MARHHKSFRGEPIDFDLMTRKNQDQVAVGNAQLNARGDLLGKGGKVVQTVEQRIAQTQRLAEEGAVYNPNVKGAVQMVSIKDNVDNMAANFSTKEQAIDKAKAFAEAAETAPTIQDIAKEAREQQKAKTGGPDESKESGNKRKVVDKDS